MINDSTNTIKGLLYLSVPELIRDAQPDDEEQSDYYAILTYNLPEKIDFDRMVEALQEKMDMNCLYKAVVLTDADAKRACMFTCQNRYCVKIVFQEEREGGVSEMEVWIYDSLEQYLEELDQELIFINEKKEKYEIDQCFTQQDLITKFQAGKIN